MQNEEDQLRLLRARRQVYFDAMILYIIQLFLLVVVPAGGAILSIFAPEIRPGVALASIAVFVVDVLYLDRAIKSLLRKSAKIGEEFDHATLSLPWNAFAVGEKVTPEEVHRYATAFAKRSDDIKLRDWYDRGVAKAPLALGRIICQRINIGYDSRLRQVYSEIVRFGALSLIAVIVVLAFAMKLSLPSLAVAFVPALPVLSWSVREFFQQRDTAAFLQSLISKEEKLWDTAKSSAQEGKLLEDSRQLQDAIFLHRASAPLILPPVYDLLRGQLEGEANSLVAARLKELCIS